MSRGCGWRRETRPAPSTWPRRLPRSSRASRRRGPWPRPQLRLRLYRGAARFDLIVKDYQGEHVTLGSDEPIQEFFADCDAVLLCLDPEGSARPADRRKRQQEVENLFERYLDRSNDGTTGRPVALLLTKFDRVLAQAHGHAVTEDDDNPASWGVEQLVEAQYGMTRHALAQHAPRGAIFAVSAYGRGANDGRPPAELHPLGLEGPLVLARRAARRPRPRTARMALGPGSRRPAPADALRPCLRATLSAVGRRSGVPRALEGAATESWQASRRCGWRPARRSWSRPWPAGISGRFKMPCPSSGIIPHPPSRGAGRDCSPGTPRSGCSGPAAPARPGRSRPSGRSRRPRSRSPTARPPPTCRRAWSASRTRCLSSSLRSARSRSRRRRPATTGAWNEVRAAALAPTDEPEKPLAEVQAFLREFPDTSHRNDALALARLACGPRAAARQSALRTEDRR